ncbi:MAG TPA: transcriptional repressor [bacterium (Candidatus Stahlbacteria)]|nr:transcriptional repressor [Candidatus Stahlbacteria bacterium]
MIEILHEDSKDHLSVKDLYELLKTRGINCNLATIYRNLNLFLQLGLVHRSNFNETHAHYEMNHAHEVHLHCVRCGKIVEIDLKRKIKLPSRLGFKVQKHLTIVSGICEECQGDD